MDRRGQMGLRDMELSASIERFPEKVKEYQEGKTGLIGLFMGEVMKLSKGKADPKTANQLVKEALDNYPSWQNHFQF